jgi:hypothetical protein
MTGERETMQLIRQGIRQRRLKEPLRGADLNKAPGITWGGNFASAQAVPMLVSCVSPTVFTA